NSELRNIILGAMMRLSKRSVLYPRSYVLTGVERDAYPVASGHFGEVYQGSYNGRRVSLKVFKLYSNQLSKRHDLLKAFFTEAILWRHLEHRNLLPFYGVYQLGDSGGRMCLVSPWMDNGNLTEYLQRNHIVNRKHLVLTFYQHCRGLSYLHKKSIVHGDLKGVNVLISNNGVACLADFGLSSIISTHSLAWTSIESTISNAGTIRWQAPELMGFGNDEDTASTKATKESDVYAFACVCYEIFVGKVPFYQCTIDAAVMRQVMLGRRPLQPESNSAPYTHWGLMDWIWSLIEECWCEDPITRLKASEIVDKLLSKMEFVRCDAGSLDIWGDLRPEAFKSIIDQCSQMSEAEIQSSISLLKSL
ncbi:kinase-like domain-containing protein, partial [Cyathus striatus]